MGLFSKNVENLLYLLSFFCISQGPDKVFNDKLYKLMC